jgi:molecular chaperone GrpE (heat shock protein)
MSDKPKISKAPFIIGDLLLLGTAAWIIWQVHPLDGWQMAAIVAAVAIAAWLGVAPFVMQFRVDTRLAEGEALSSTTKQLGDLQSLARQISTASAEWQQIHQGTTQIVTAADQVAEKVINEARNFSQVLTGIDETEKKHLRLEIEKLRRGEGEWLQVIVRLLDHVYALHQAALRSGQRNVIEQITAFQNACRDTARRVGMMTILPQPGVAYDPRQHQLADGQKAAAEAKVAETIAPGYTYQGQLLRLPLVATLEATPAEETPRETPQTQLPLEEATKPAVISSQPH